VYTPKPESVLPAAPRRRRERHLTELVARPPFEVRGDMRARVIWTLFRERGLTWVPVVDESGHPIGTLLRADLAAAFGGGAEVALPGGDRPTVEDVMRNDVSVVGVNASVDEARALLEAGQLTDLVVVDRRGIMLGTVSRETLVLATGSEG
jgi:predicted transcriptional regulator